MSLRDSHRANRDTRRSHDWTGATGTVTRHGANRRRNRPFIVIHSTRIESHHESDCGEPEKSHFQASVECGVKIVDKRVTTKLVCFGNETA